VQSGRWWIKIISCEQRLAGELGKVSKSVFRGDPSRSKQIVRSNNALRRALIAVGTTGDRLALARDALLGIGRVAPFVLSLRKDWIIPEFEARLEAVTKDIASLNDYEGHLSNKVQFLLDAILGFITIQQNDLFKVLTIVSVVGIPPTVVAGIYGMNFKYMPELNWTSGYARPRVVPQDRPKMVQRSTPSISRTASMSAIRWAVVLPLRSASGSSASGPLRPDPR
jgi:Mg2+ and Co2+ transporter CorA